MLLAAATGQVYTKKKEMETEGNDAPAPKQSSFDCLWCVTVEQRQVDVPFFGLNQVNFFHTVKVIRNGNVLFRATFIHTCVCRNSPLWCPNYQRGIILS